jgi:Putative zinc-finger
MNTYPHCEWSRTASSLRLERRLPPAATKRLETHLSGCADCRGFDRDVTELRERISSMPHESAPVDLAAAVRERALYGKRSWILHSATAHRAAGVLVAAFSLFVAYSLGKIASEPKTHTFVFEVPASPLFADFGSRGSDAGSPPVAVEDSAANAPSEATSSTSDESRRIGRAMRAMLTDLAVIDEIPEPQRKPLIESQLQHFGLDAWAAGVGSKDSAPASQTENDLATLVRKVSTALDAGPGALLDIKSDRKTTELFAMLGGIEPPRGESTAAHGLAVIDLSTYAEELSPLQLKALEELLGFKESWVEGEIGTALDNAAQRGGAVVASEAKHYAPVLRANIASAVAGAGSPGGDEGRAKGATKDSRRAAPGMNAIKNAKVRFGNGFRSTVVTVEVPVDEEQ